MAEISKGVIEEAFGRFNEAANAYGGIIDEDVPRPKYADFEQWAIEQNIQLSKGEFIVAKREVIPRFAGLLAMVVVPRRGRQPEQVPGIILQDERRVGVLGGYDRMSPLVQGLLSTVYLNNLPSVLEHPDGMLQAGRGGHAVIAASQLSVFGDAHVAAHEFNESTFGREITRQGLQDVQTGEGDVLVRSGVYPLAKVALRVAKEFQPPTADLLDSGIAGQAANIALTFAATLSNPDTASKINLSRSLEQMTQQV